MVLKMSRMSRLSKRRNSASQNGDGMASTPRGERLQIMLTQEELQALDTWRFSRHMPSRAAAIRELLRRGLSAEGFSISDGVTKSSDYGVME